MHEPAERASDSTPRGDVDKSASGAPARATPPAASGGVIPRARRSVAPKIDGARDSGAPRALLHTRPRAQRVTNLALSSRTTRDSCLPRVCRSSRVHTAPYGIYNSIMRRTFCSALGRARASRVAARQPQQHPRECSPMASVRDLVARAAPAANSSSAASSAMSSAMSNARSNARSSREMIRHCLYSTCTRSCCP